MAAVTEDDVLRVAQAVGFDVPPSELGDYRQLLDQAREALEFVVNSDDLDAAPRTDVHFPEPQDNPHNAWAWRCRCASTKPSSELLAGKTLCLKDNIAMAGVPCLLGTDSFAGWVPATDATVVARVLDHGATVAGKAVCENLSRGCVSNTAATGPVHNPYARGYSAGGSSSGTAALVASGAVDMGLGCDQGGSIRIPAGLCGLYGLKPTTGLVPYTGIASNDASLDYVGPMTTTCADCAALLQAIAGADGLDDRAGPGTPFPRDVPPYRDLLAKTPREAREAVRGLRIGVLVEGLQSPVLDPGVAAKFRAAVDGFAALGAVVSEVSVPLHARGRAFITVLGKMGNHMGMLGRATGRRQVMLTDLLARKELPYSAAAIARMNMVSKDGLLAGEYGWTHYPLAYPKAVNLTRKLRDAYDAALEQVDLLVMPTTVTPSSPFPAPDAPPLDHARAASGKLENTSPFNGTGHPALAMPIGFVPALADPAVQVPASMQIVGRFFDEVRILQTAFAWENAYDWKTF